jgi:alpha-ketoglutarate-dependent taurine dioxygenase
VAISNQKPDGTVLQADEHRYKSLRGNEGWHTDSSYMPLAAKASVLSAQVVPSRDGETEWADMRAAYDALDEATGGASRGSRRTTRSITRRPRSVTWSKPAAGTAFTPRASRFGRW